MPLLGDDAGVAEMAIVLDRWHLAHHVFLAQLVQGVDVQVAIALMPQPCLISLARGPPTPRSGEAELLLQGSGSGEMDHLL